MGSGVVAVSYRSEFDQNTLPSFASPPQQQSHQQLPGNNNTNNPYYSAQRVLSPPPVSAFSSNRSPRRVPAPLPQLSNPVNFNYDESRDFNDAGSPEDRMFVHQKSLPFQYDPQQSQNLNGSLSDNNTPLIHNDRAASIDLYEAYGSNDIGLPTRPDSAVSREADIHSLDDRSSLSGHPSAHSYQHFQIQQQQQPHQRQQDIQGSNAGSVSGGNRYENNNNSRDRSRGSNYNTNRNDSARSNLNQSNSRDYNSNNNNNNRQSQQQHQRGNNNSNSRDFHDVRDLRDARGDVRDSRGGDSRDFRETRDNRIDERRVIVERSNSSGARDSISTRGASRSPPPNRRKRDDDDDFRYGSKRSKLEVSLDLKCTTNSSSSSSGNRDGGGNSTNTRSSAVRSGRDEDINTILILCDNHPEKLDKALELVKALIASDSSSSSSSSDNRVSVTEQISVIRKVMVAGCRARRVRIAQQAYELIIDLRASWEPSSGDLVELLSMYVATGKADLMNEMLATVKPNLTLSNISVLWQTALVVPKKGRAILGALTKLLVNAMDKNSSPSNEFFGIVVLELIAANLTEWMEKILFKLNVKNVPSRSSYHSQMAPRTSIPLKRGIFVAVIEFFIRIRNARGAFDCLKYMYDVGYVFHEESLFGVFKLVLTGTELDVVDEVFKMIKSVPGLYLSNPLLFDEALAVACSNDKVGTAIDIIEHMAQTKTRPSVWSSILPVMRLASSLDMLQKFVGVFNVFFTTEGEGSSSAPHSDMNPVLISELLTNCVAHGMFTHAFWYFKYMSHANIPRTREAYRSLIFALDQDPRGLKGESQSLWADIGTNQYPASTDQMGTIFKALLLHGGLDAKKAALEIYDTVVGSDRRALISSVNPNALLDFIFYFDRDNEGFALFEELCDADPTWPSTLTDNVSILLFQKGGDQGRFDVLQLVVDRLRASGQTVPNRQLVRNLIGCLASVRSTDPHRVLLATQIYIWGVKAGTSGYIKTKELSNLNIRLEECWCLLDLRLHLLRCLEWMHREVPKNQVNGDLKVNLPPVCSVLNSNPSGNAIVKLKGPVLANCVKYEIKTWFSGKLDVRVETDERDRDGSKSYLVVTKQSVLEWMAYNFGPTFEVDSIFNCMAEIRDKAFEGGSLLFSKENNQERKQDFRRNDTVGGGSSSNNNNRNNNCARGSGDQFGGRGGNQSNSGNNNFADRGARHFKRDETGRRDRRDDYNSQQRGGGSVSSSASHYEGSNSGRDVHLPPRLIDDEAYGNVTLDRHYDDDYEFQQQQGLSSRSLSGRGDDLPNVGDYQQQQYGDDKRRMGWQ
ncbi:UNVERIFIED_CONTAM: hypothetical protein HDU68_007744 [Siphonaria sp. JEL0065]|nr:hypothetical protein HDU68_007744 [Siphonaria sp. JEL0065]